jgi:hypothetical protein
MTDPKNSGSPDESFRDYAWKYFELHADQRLKTFHFFIVLATAVTGAFGLLLRNGTQHKWMIVLGVLLILLAFVFWKLDRRTRQLVKNAEAALKYLDAQHGLSDQDGLPHPLRLFARDESLTRDLKALPLISGHFSYSLCFEWIFSIVAMVGVGIAVACLFMPA